MNGETNGRVKSPLATNNDGQVAKTLQRGLDALYEGNNDETTEEIRKLDSQLDHLNDYMDKVEIRLREHNEKLMTTLKEQREERERRRRSFQERLATNNEEDAAFQRQMASILNRVDTSRNRQSIYDIISTMEVPTDESVAAAKTSP